MICNHKTVSKISKKEAVLLGKVIRALFLVEKHNHASRRRRDALDFQCHSICIALASLLPDLKVVHGCFCGIKQIWRNGKLVNWKLVRGDHSWLATSRKNIIDPHPISILASNPLIVVGRGDKAPFGSGLYVRGHIDKKRYTNEKVRVQVRALKVFFAKQNRLSFFPC